MCIRNLRQWGKKAGMYKILVDKVAVKYHRDESQEEHVVAAC